MFVKCITLAGRAATAKQTPTKQRQRFTSSDGFDNIDR